jgi:hypothetical protein
MEKRNRNWSLEEREIVRKLRLQGLSFTQIASDKELLKLRKEISRSAVARQVNVLGLSQKKPRGNTYDDTDCIEYDPDKDSFKLTMKDRENSLLSTNENLCFCGKVKVSRNYCNDHLIEYARPDSVKKALDERLKRLAFSDSKKMIEN